MRGAVREWYSEEDDQVGAVLTPIEVRRVPEPAHPAPGRNAQVVYTDLRWSAK